MSIWSVGTNGRDFKNWLDLEENISTDETNEHYPAGYEDFTAVEAGPRSCRFMRPSKNRFEVISRKWRRRMVSEIVKYLLFGI